jgi:hypothetical protein
VAGRRIAEPLACELLHRRKSLSHNGESPSRRKSLRHSGWQLLPQNVGIPEILPESKCLTTGSARPVRRKLGEYTQFDLVPRRISLTLYVVVELVLWHKR